MYESLVLKPIIPEVCSVRVMWLGLYHRLKGQGLYVDKQVAAWKVSNACSMPGPSQQGFHHNGIEGIVWHGKCIAPGFSVFIEVAPCVLVSFRPSSPLLLPHLICLLC